MTTFEYIMLKKTLNEQKKFNMLPRIEEIHEKSEDKPSFEHLGNNNPDKIHNGIHPIPSAFNHMTPPK